MKIHHKVDVAPRRAAAYMPIEAQLDAIFKGFAALKEQGVTLPQETLDWIAHCQAVKASLPKCD